MTIEIREAVLEDAPALADFAARLFAEHLPGILTRPAPSLEDEIAFLQPYLRERNSALLMARDEGRVVGLLDFRGGSEPEVMHAGMVGLAVASGWRGRGIGTALLSALQSWAPSHGISRIEIQAWASNPRALALYERCGFVREGVLRGAIVRDGATVDVFTLALLL